MKIVVAMPVTEEHKKWLNAAAGDYPVYFADNQAAVGVQVPEDVLSDTEIIIGNLDPELVKKAPHLRWMQLNSAGTGACVHKKRGPAGRGSPHQCDRSLRTGLVRTHAGPAAGDDEEIICLL